MSRRLSDEEALASSSRRLRSLAAAIEDIEKRLLALAGALPRSTERDAMFECLIPYDVAAEHFAVAESICEDYLRPAARALERAARVRQQDLDARFRRYVVFPR